jgi:hypothetical protein
MSVARRIPAESWQQELSPNTVQTRVWTDIVWASVAWVSARVTVSLLNLKQLLLVQQQQQTQLQLAAMGCPGWRADKN